MLAITLCGTRSSAAWRSKLLLHEKLSRASRRDCAAPRSRSQRTSSSRCWAVWYTARRASTTATADEPRRTTTNHDGRLEPRGPAGATTADRGQRPPREAFTLRQRDPREAFALCVKPCLNLRRCGQWPRRTNHDEQQRTTTADWSHDGRQEPHDRTRLEHNLEHNWSTI